MSRKKRPLLLVSACLAGEACRYDGCASAIPRLAALAEAGLALAVCPELEGGLSVPRPPCELRDGRVLTRDGRDLTAEFKAGAARVLDLALAGGIALAVLKENSPSCGSVMIHDGNFSGKLVPGRGIAAALLGDHGIQIRNEHDCEEALRPLIPPGDF